MSAVFLRWFSQRRQSNPAIVMRECAASLVIPAGCGYVYRRLSLPQFFFFSGEILMGILSWIVFGLIAGVLAKLLMPGDDPGGIIVTILLGIAGAVVGGFIGTLLGFGGVGGFDFRGLLIAIGGTMLLLGGYRMLKKKS